MEKHRYIPVDHESLAAHIDKKRGTMKVQEFAEYMGTSRQVVDQWKKGEGLPRPVFLEKLGLRPCFEVLDDSPLSTAAPAPVVKTREDLLRENARLNGQVERLQRELEGLKGGKKPVRKA